MRVRKTYRDLELYLDENPGEMRGVVYLDSPASQLSKSLLSRVSVFRNDLRESSRKYLLFGSSHHLRVHHQAVLTL